MGCFFMFPIWDSVSPELSWTHYRYILKVEDKNARSFYVKEAIDGNIVENTCASQTELCLMDVNVPDNKQVMINGGKLSNFPVTRREQYGQVIEFVYCEIK